MRGEPTSNWRQRRPGFTLVELLVAISVLAILVGASSVAFNNARTKGRDSLRKQDLSAISGALALYIQDNGLYPYDANNVAKLTFASNETQPWIPGLVSTYIGKLPVDPKQISLYFIKEFAALFKEDLEIVKPVYADQVKILPNGSGTYTQWTAQNPTGGSHWDKVDEDPHDGDSTYISTSSTSRKDTFVHAASGIPAGSTISQVQVCNINRDTTGGSTDVKMGVTIRSGAVDASGPLTQDTQDSYGFVFCGSWSTDPATGGAWSVASVDSLQFGVQTNSSGVNSTARVTQVYMLVTYTPPAPPTYPSYPTYPGYPSYPTYPGYPTYPAYPPAYPSYPTYPNYPTYPSYPGAGVEGKYLYVVSSDYKTYTLWTQLENTNDAQIYSKPNADCRDAPPSGTTYNFCLKPSF